MGILTSLVPCPGALDPVRQIEGIFVDFFLSHLALFGHSLSCILHLAAERTKRDSLVYTIEALPFTLSPP